MSSRMAIHSALKNDSRISSSISSRMAVESAVVAVTADSTAILLLIIRNNWNINHYHSIIIIIIIRMTTVMTIKVHKIHWNLTIDKHIMRSLLLYTLNLAFNPNFSCSVSKVTPLDAIASWCGLWIAGNSSFNPCSE